MSLQALMNEQVDLLERNGRLIAPIRANVQATKIYAVANGVVISPGHLIRRNLSNGAQEIYEVVNPVFYERIGSIPANYQMFVRKQGVAEAGVSAQSITYNVSGANARVNHQSIDRSLNMGFHSRDLLSQIAELRRELDKAPLAEADRSDALDIVTALEGEVGKEAMSKKVIAALLGGLPHVSNVTSIVASILSILAK